MEQFRQRVAATCHIGPLDQAETKAYIEHRLKCAGSTDKPSWGDGAHEAIYKATRGIPRRINSVCDRVLLLGFLNGRTHLSADDVNEVVKELEAENAVPPRKEGVSVPAPLPSDSVPGELYAGSVGGMPLDLDLSKFKVDPATADSMSKQLSRLSAEQRLDQMQRLERSLLRLERINVQTLSMLQKLVSAAKQQGTAAPAPAAQPSPSPSDKDGA